MRWQTQQALGILAVFLSYVAVAKGVETLLHWPAR